MALVLMDFDTPQAEIFAPTKVLKNTDDLNDIQTFGIYSWSSGSTPSHSPQPTGSALSAALFVLRFASVGLIQVAFNDTYVLFRVYTSNTWSSWRRIAGTVIS